MIVIHVQVKVKPDHREDFITVALNDVLASRQQPGCAKFNVSESVDERNTFTLYEEWQTQADFDAYKNSAHFKQMGEQLMPLFADAPDSRYYTADVLPST